MSTTRQPVASETSIQLAIMDYLRWQKFWILRQNVGGMVNPSGKHVRFGITGLPDLLALRDGRYVWIEVKRPGEKPTEKQREVHAELRHYGATVIVATSVDDVAAALGLPAFAA